MVLSVKRLIHVINLINLFWKYYWF
jgi:hypothetical protein